MNENEDELIVLNADMYDLGLSNCVHIVSHWNFTAHKFECIKCGRLELFQLDWKGRGYLGRTRIKV